MSNHARALVVILLAAIVGCGDPGSMSVDSGRADSGTDAAARGDSGPMTLDAHVADDASNDAPSIDASADAGADAPSIDGGSAGSPGCGMSGMQTGYHNGLTITTSGASRTYAFSVPASYDPTRPYALVFVFHGDGGTGAGIRGGFPIEAAAGTNAIFVYPDATAASGRSFDLESPLGANADIRFVQDTIASVRAQYCIDEHRVFAAGMSRGGFFSNILNCRLGSSVFRAVAPHSGSIYAADSSGYTSSGHVLCEGAAAPAILFHGVTDGSVPFTDGQYARDQWIWAESCGTTTHAYAPSPCVEYDGCTAPGRVVWCAIPGMGHSVWSMAGAASWAFFDTFH